MTIDRHLRHNGIKALESHLIKIRIATLFACLFSNKLYNRFFDQIRPTPWNKVIKPIDALNIHRNDPSHYAFDIIRIGRRNQVILHTLYHDRGCRYSRKQISEFL